MDKKKYRKQTMIFFKIFMKFWNLPERMPKLRSIFLWSMPTMKSAE